MFPIRKADEAIQPFPVATIAPFRPLAWVAKSRSAARLIVWLGRHFVESDFGTTGLVVVGPTPNDGIEFAKRMRRLFHFIQADRMWLLR